MDVGLPEPARSIQNADASGTTAVAAVFRPPLLPVTTAGPVLRGSQRMEAALPPQALFSAYPEVPATGAAINERERQGLGSGDVTRRGASGVAGARHNPNVDSDDTAASRCASSLRQGVAGWRERSVAETSVGGSARRECQSVAVLSHGTAEVGMRGVCGGVRVGPGSQCAMSSGRADMRDLQPVSSGNRRGVSGASADFQRASMNAEAGVCGVEGVPSVLEAGEVGVPGNRRRASSDEAGKLRAELNDVVDSDPRIARHAATAAVELPGRIARQRQRITSGEEAVADSRASQWPPFTGGGTTSRALPGVASVGIVASTNPRHVQRGSSAADPASPASSPFSTRSL
eukprot:NODE_6022_length_1712_cov_4.779811.p2 GENE.NODE_6022_length_1712_cov_4.779811~~NODE_6022_length_1712_cov_4.779811.p2  ORF type:complete len:346 (-),score=51.12 NODE_6022_length_1712_cov_4.779811:567-1604(-)